MNFHYLIAISSPASKETVSNINHFKLDSMINNLFNFFQNNILMASKDVCYLRYNNINNCLSN